MVGIKHDKLYGSYCFDNILFKHCTFKIFINNKQRINIIFNIIVCVSRFVREITLAKFSEGMNLRAAPLGPL